jgi:hypothetical protein
VEDATVAAGVLRFNTRSYTQCKFCINPSKVLKLDFVQEHQEIYHQHGIMLFLKLLL